MGLTPLNCLCARTMTASSQPMTANGTSSDFESRCHAGDQDSPFGPAKLRSASTNSCIDNRVEHWAKPAPPREIGDTQSKQDANA